MVHGDGMDAGPTLAGRALAADAGPRTERTLAALCFWALRHALWRFDLVAFDSCMMPTEHAWRAVSARLGSDVSVLGR